MTSVSANLTILEGENPQEPLVSVILPTYNRVDTLPRAIESVLVQTWQNFELLVVDDGSNDGTNEVCRVIRDLRFRFICSPRNYGAAAARNLGVRKSVGEFIAFQDSDDEWHPTKLEEQIKVLRQADRRVGLVYTNYLLCTASTMRSGISRLRTFLGRISDKSRLAGEVQLALSRGNFISTQTVILRKACLESVGGFDERLARFQDWDLWLRIAGNYQVEFIDQPLVKVIPSPDRISINWQAMLEAFEIILAKYHPDSQIYRELQAQRIYAVGDMYLHQRSVKKARRCFYRAVRLAPDNLVYWLAALSSMAGGKTCRLIIRRLGLTYYAS